MKILTNFPVFEGCLDPFPRAGDLHEAISACGLDGLEVIWGDPAFAGHGMEPSLTVGYHLPFWHDWVDFWRGDEKALLRKFGSPGAVTGFYGGRDPACLIERYRQELERAVALGAEYVVFHVSDVSIEEGYTYQWEHTHQEVIDASLELINDLTGGRRWPFAVLVENQWWPGFTFTDPELTRYLLDGIRHPDKGLLLDTGHLMNTNPALNSEADALAYLHRMLDHQADLIPSIRGIHLHQSLSGDYVLSSAGQMPEGLHPDYLQRYAQTYPHILQIDRHEPWTHPGIRKLIARIDPEWLTHELSAPWPDPRFNALAVQNHALGR